MFDIFSRSFNIFLAIIGMIPILYWYLTRNYNYWSKQGIKGPKPVLFFGNVLDMAKKSMAMHDQENFRKYGSVYGLFLGRSPVLQISEPELIKQVLVKDFNRFNNRRELNTEHPIVDKSLLFSRSEHWKRIRTIASSTFTSVKMKKMYGLIGEILDEYLEHLEEVANSGQYLNAKEINQNLAMDVIACCAFATKANSFKDPKNPFIVNGRKMLVFKPSRFIPAFAFPKFLNKLLNIRSYFDPEAADWFSNLAKHLVEKRSQTGEKNNDFLQLLIDAKADDSKKGDINEGLESQFINEDDEDISKEKQSIENKSMTEDEIMAQCWIFMLAGFDTTAATMGYMSYELAMNPDIQERLHNEIVTAMGSDNEISYDDLHRLPFLDACISETLRLYPPGNRLEREANQDLVLGDSGIKLLKGQLVEIPLYALHHSERFFKDADKYIPERFLPENRSQILPYTYIPFGTGPRNCIGMRFALMEIKLAMAHILKRFRFTKCDKTEKTLQFKPMVIVLDPVSITVAIEKR